MIRSHAMSVQASKSSVLYLEHYLVQTKDKENFDLWLKAVCTAYVKLIESYCVYKSVEKEYNEQSIT